MAQSKAPSVVEWQGELEELSLQLLRSLQVQHTVRHLKQVVKNEYETCFQHATDWPKHFSPIYIDAYKNISKQVEALQNVLRSYDVDTEILEFAISDLGDCEKPTVVLLQNSVETAGRLAFLSELDETNVAVWLPGIGSRTLSLEDFEAAWTGLVLNFRRFDESIEPNLQRHIWEQRLRIGGIAGLFVVLAITLGAAGTSFHGGALLLAGGLGILLVKLIGLTACLGLEQIERQAVRGKSAFQQFCQLHERFSCQRVLASKGARLFGILSWSLVGKVYFLSTGLGILLSAALGHLPETLSALLAVSVSALPFTVYSVAYQAKVVRAWCPLCLTVQAVLWLEASGGAMVWRSGVLQVPSLGTVAMLAFLGAATSLYVWQERRHEIAEWRHRMASYRLSSLQRNPDGFLALLKAGTPVRDCDLPGDLRFGSSDSPIQLVAMLDPQCHRCARCFFDLRRLAGRYPNRFGVRIRLVNDFTPLTTAEDLVALVVADEGSNRAEVFLESWYRHVLSLMESGQIAGSGDVTQRIYSNWLASQNGSFILEKTNQAREACDLMLHWEQEQEITAWPAMFINGFSWPPYFNRYRHLLHHVEMMTEVLQSGDGSVPSKPQSAA